MAFLSGNFTQTNLSQILQGLVQNRTTGYLTLREGGEEGLVAVEKGMIINAKTGVSTGMPALFQFVGWHGAHFEFKEEPIRSDLPRDLAVYDPQVLIAGVAAKVGEWTASQQAQLAVK